jgi:Protein of unknown function (DUF4231)
VRRPEPAKPFDRHWLEEDLGGLIEEMRLPPGESHFLRSRWLESILWMEAAAQRTRTRYYALRLVTVVGAVIIPALVSLNVVGSVDRAVTWATFALSLVVAVSAALEEFFRLGERWRHYRVAVEELKAEGWAFYGTVGRYEEDGYDRSAGFPTFAARVEEILARETDTYIAKIAKPPPSPDVRREEPPKSKAPQGPDGLPAESGTIRPDGGLGQGDR